MLVLIFPCCLSIISLTSIDGGDAMAYSLLKLSLFMRSDEGSDGRAQGLIEYALIILLVVIVVIVTLRLLGVQVTNLFQDITNSFPES